MRALLLGARGAVGRVVRRELTRSGHAVTAASRSAEGEAAIDLRGDLTPYRRLARTHDVVVNASGIERTDLTTGIDAPLVEISATGTYLEALAEQTSSPIVLGAGLAPGLSTILVSALDHRPGDDIDVLVMLGSGEHHGPAALAWTTGLVGTRVHRPPDGTAVRNFRSSLRALDPDGVDRRYLRADFPDHILLGPDYGLAIRSYLALSSPAMTAALGLVSRAPWMWRTLSIAPHIGSQRWHVLARSRRTGQQLHAEGIGQSEATGRLTALATERAASKTLDGPVTMAELVGLDDARAVLR